MVQIWNRRLKLQLKLLNSPNLNKGKVLAIDYGKRRIGIASGDLEVGIAFPRTVIENKSREYVLGQLLKICSDIQVKMIIVGLPLSMQEDQRENRIMKDLKSFIENLKVAMKDIEVVLFDERLSSFEADQLMSEYNMKGPDDSYAAQIILQRFFHNMKA